MIWREQTMKHFTDETWFDFARGVLPSTNVKILQQHLDEGCEECNRICRIWREVVQVVRREADYEPAESAIRVIKAAFPETRLTKLLPGQAKIARLLFDSFRDPATAAFGVRTTSTRARQMLHRAGSWTIDLRLESEAGRRLSVAGQVLRSGPKPASEVSMEVILMSGETLLAQTSTNPFGEFWLECEHQKDLHVYLDVAGCRPVGIALPDPDQ
jgi:hypothetical protein